jgi:hypothetical protein
LTADKPRGGDRQHGGSADHGDRDGPAQLPVERDEELLDLSGRGAVSAVQIRGVRLPDQVLVFSGVEAPSKK